MNGHEQIIVGNTPLIVDWAALRKQRGALASVTIRGCMERAEAKEKLRYFPKSAGEMLTAMEGIESFLDAFVDASAEVLGEEVVFGRKLS